LLCWASSFLQVGSWLAISYTHVVPAPFQPKQVGCEHFHAFLVVLPLMQKIK
jgi:hypothetical protein